MSQESTVLELIKKAKEAIVPLSDALQADSLDLFMIKDQSRHLTQKNLDLIKTNQEIEKQNDELVKHGQDIVAKAKAEADSIIKIAEENLVMAQKEKALAEADREKAKREVNMAVNRAKEIAST